VALGKISRGSSEDTQLNPVAQEIGSKQRSQAPCRARGDGLFFEDCAKRKWVQGLSPCPPEAFLVPALAGQGRVARMTGPRVLPLTPGRLRRLSPSPARGEGIYSAAGR
jgi:hypothetical protein